MRRPTLAPSLGLLATLAVSALALTACTPPQGAAADPSTPAPEQSTPAAEESPSTQASPSASAPVEAEEPDYVRGLPQGVGEPPAETPGGAGWSSDGTLLYVVTWGSSSCPSVASTLTEEAGVIEVELVEMGGAVCTTDFSPTTSTVDVTGLDTSAESVITLGTIGDVTVPAAADPVVMGWLPVPAA